MNVINVHGEKVKIGSLVGSANPYFPQLNHVQAEMNFKAICVFLQISRLLSSQFYFKT